MGDDRLRILAVKAHPHDFTHCAGTLGIHVGRGDSVTVVTVTSGAYVHNEQLSAELAKPKGQQDPNIVDQPPDKYAEEKAAELRQAAAVFGITDVRILHGKEPFLVDENPDIVEKLTEIILEERPDILISQSTYLTGSGHHGQISGYLGDDHLNAAFAVQKAQYWATSPRPGASRPPHRIAETYYPGVYFNRDDWDVVVDTTDQYENRVEAEALFKSQGHTMKFSRKRIEISCGAAGWSAGVAYAEGFVRARPEVVSSLAVGPYARRSATEPATDHLKRMAGEIR